MKKKIIINSHERAGTHFLMNSIANNFGYLSHPWIDLDNLPFLPYVPSNMLMMLKMVADNEKTKNGIVKSHYNGHFFTDKVLEELSERYHIFYIHRNVEDTLKSCMKHFNDIKEKQGWNGGTQCKTYEEFVKAEPWGAMLRYQYQQYSTMIARLEDHHKSWLNREHVIYIDFKELDENFNNTINSLAIKLDMQLFHGTPIKPTKAGTIQEGVFQEKEVVV